MTTIADITSRQLWLGIQCEACGRSTHVPRPPARTALPRTRPSTSRPRSSAARCQAPSNTEAMSLTKGVLFGDDPRGDQIYWHTYP
jgi:hypothetical protein